METANRLKFIQGDYGQYDQIAYKDAIYFAMDTANIILNDKNFSSTVLSGATIEMPDTTNRTENIMYFNTDLNKLILWISSLKKWVDVNGTPVELTKSK